MVTSSTRSLLLTALVALLPACGSAVGGGGNPPGGETGPEPGPVELRYPGKGFVVHEWGTDTVVVGSDGSLQRGLHHEEDDLPSFVYDRIKAGALDGSSSVEVKMETPVTYFYSEAARTVDVAVDFPQGIFTQWYPAVASFYPFIVAPNAAIGVDAFGDPALDPGFEFGSQSCSDKYGKIAAGLLDWGKVEVLPRGAAPSGMPDAPLDAFTWSYARDVDANPVSVGGVPGAMGAAQPEKFLFYRGLGNFELPLRVTSAGETVKLSNPTKLAIPAAIVINVGADGGAFTVRKQALGAGESADVAVPSLVGAPSKDAYADALGVEVTKALDATGLYHDEAAAMVNTWKRQWFATPGVRVLYLVPQEWTDASIPLSVSPKPDEVLRVMMIRVEVITPELEAGDVAAAEALASAATADQAKGHFTALGRFAEPRLRRALSMLGDPAYGQALLAEVTTADTRVGAGE